MATPRRSVVLVVLGVLAAATAGASYFFFVFTRDEDLREAQAQVRGWEERWLEARACLFGQPPLAAEVSDAILTHELTNGQLGDAEVDCSRQVGRLVRPEGNASQLDAVEAAWKQLEDAGTRVAKRYVAYRGAPGELGPLVEALHHLRKVRSTLRRVVELSMEDAPMGPALHELAITPLVLDGQPVTELVGAGAGPHLIGRMAVGERWVMGTLRQRGAQLEVTASPVAADVVRSAPDGTWGISAVFDPAKADLMRLSAGALDAGGRLTATQELASSPPSLLPAAALGQGVERAALYVTSNEKESALHVSQSSDAGKTWRKLTLPWVSGNVFADGEGSADAVFQQAAPHALHWQRVQAASLPTLPSPRPWPGATLVAACPAPAAPWVLASVDDELYLARMDRPEAPVPVSDGALSSILDCDDRGVLLASDGGERLVGCVELTCEPFALHPGAGVGLVVAGTPRFATARHSLLAVFAPTGAPQFVRLPAGAALYGAYALDGQPLLVVKRESGALWAGVLR
ncbi:MAG: hypothetical protein IPI49_20390 [Myxococcales bacterium]|nr:hypothetical protein [Myxococcales bacterium]